jgi:hypothetical protein
MSDFGAAILTAAVTFVVLSRGFINTLRAVYFYLFRVCTRRPQLVVSASKARAAVRARFSHHMYGRLNILTSVMLDGYRFCVQPFLIEETYIAFVDGYTGEVTVSTLGRDSTHS